MRSLALVTAAMIAPSLSLGLSPPALAPGASWAWTAGDVGWVGALDLSLAAYCPCRLTLGVLSRGAGEAMGAADPPRPVTTTAATGRRLVLRARLGDLTLFVSLRWIGGAASSAADPAPGAVTRHHACAVPAQAGRADRRGWRGPTRWRAACSPGTA